MVCHSCARFVEITNASTVHSCVILVDIWSQRPLCKIRCIYIRIPAFYVENISLFHFRPKRTPRILTQTHLFLQIRLSHQAPRTVTECRSVNKPCQIRWLHSGEHLVAITKHRPYKCGAIVILHLSYFFCMDNLTLFLCDYSANERFYLPRFCIYIV